MVVRTEDNCLRIIWGGNAVGCGHASGVHLKQLTDDMDSNFCSVIEVYTEPADNENLAAPLDYWLTDEHILKDCDLL